LEFTDKYSDATGRWSNPDHQLYFLAGAFFPRADALTRHLIFFLRRRLPAFGLGRSLKFRCQISKIFARFAIRVKKIDSPVTTSPQLRNYFYRVAQIATQVARQK
jgi:hypothetical protein